MQALVEYILSSRIVSRVPGYKMETKKKVKFNQVKYQYITVLGGVNLFRCLCFSCQSERFLTVNIISLCHGFAVGWLSAAVPILKSDETPLQSTLTVEQTMWLGGVYPLGGFVGNCLFGVLVNYFGLITSMSLLALPNFVRE